MPDGKRSIMKLRTAHQIHFTQCNDHWMMEYTKIQWDKQMQCTTVEQRRIKIAFMIRNSLPRTIPLDHK